MISTELSAGAVEPLPETQMSAVDARMERRAVFAGAAGALIAASFPPYHLPFLLPFGFALLLAALDGLRPRQGFYLGIMCGAVTFGATLFWLSNLFGAAAVSLIAIASSFTLLFGVFFTFLRPRLPNMPLWLLAPILWTGIEYFRSEPFPLSFGWLGFGYGVVNSPVAAKIASIIGCYGVTFLVALFGSALYLAGSRRKQGAFAGIAVAWLAVMYIPLATPRPENPLKVRMVQATCDDEDDLFKLSRVSPEFRPDIVLWPEYALHIDPMHDAGTWDKLRGFTRNARAYLVFGATERVKESSDEPFYNTAFVMDPSGTIVGRHHKNHPVHLIKDGLPGKSARAIPTSVGKLGVAICFDMDYPEVARKLAQDGAEVFLVPNMDPAEWGPVQPAQHRLMFQMRAAECGKWLARADVAGGTSVSAPNGQDVARIASGEPGRLDATVGKNRNRTLFVQGGWVFGPACLASSGLLFIAGLITLRPKIDDAGACDEDVS
jgi:apolipoprotein N-acyltransferase